MGKSESMVNLLPWLSFNLIKFTTPVEVTKPKAPVCINHSVKIAVLFLFFRKCFETFKKGEWKNNAYISGNTCSDVFALLRFLAVMI